MEQGPQSMTTGSSARYSNRESNIGNQATNISIDRQTNFFGSQRISDEDIPQRCLESLQCPPDPSTILLNLHVAKGEVIPEAIAWVLEHDQYRRWKDGEDISLLWIRGGAGKGKTMMSIGLIKELGKTRSKAAHDQPTVIYFFCQNADERLNTAEAVLKGLILRLFKECRECRSTLREELWDSENQRPREGAQPLQGLWDLFSKMMHKCWSRRIYVIVDALDECRPSGLQELLRLIAGHGSSWQTDVKWLLTSRPQREAEHAVFPGNNDREQLSLDLNSEHIARAVAVYVSKRVNWLQAYHGYGPELKDKITTMLNLKAEGTFLWVSLVCERLKRVPKENALATVDDSRPGLQDFYTRMFRELQLGADGMVTQRMRLLKTMLLALRPLRVEELQSIGIPGDEALQNIDSCGFVVRIREDTLEFVHQSARDFLISLEGGAIDIPDSFQTYGHIDITINALKIMSTQLKVNVLDVEWPTSGKEVDKILADSKPPSSLSQLEYAATSWGHHFCEAHRSMAMASGRQLRQAAVEFLTNKVFEWFECLGWLHSLRNSITTLRMMEQLLQRAEAKSPEESVLYTLVRDALRVVMRHANGISACPLEAYGSAILFSPIDSINRQNNKQKMPRWITGSSLDEEGWPPMLQMLTGHTDSVTAVAFAPDSRTLASASSDWTVRVWDAATGALLRTLKGHEHEVTAIAFAPADSRTLVSASQDKTVRVWDVAIDAPLRTLAGHTDQVTAVAFTPDGRMLASASWDKTVQVWDVATGAPLRTLRHSRKVMAVAFAPDGRTLASASSDLTVRVWDATTGAMLRTLKGYEDKVTAIAFAPADSRTLAPASQDTSGRVLDIVGGALLRKVRDWLGQVTTVAFAPDGTTLALGSEDKGLQVWDAAAGALLHVLADDTHPVTAVAFAPDGRTLVSASQDKTVRVWDAVTYTLLRTLAGHTDQVTAVAFAPDGRTLASASWDKTVRIWSAATGAPLHMLADQEDWVAAVVLVPGGCMLASGSKDKTTVQVWDVVTGTLLRTLAGHLVVEVVAFAPDGSMLASVSEGTTIRVWDVTTGALLRTLHDKSWVVAVAFTPDGRMLASASWGTVRVWDVTMGALLRTLRHTGKLMAVAFAPDGRTLASASIETVRVWDAPRPASDATNWFARALQPFQVVKCLQSIPVQATVHDLRYSTSGQELLTDKGRFLLDSTLTGSPRDIKNEVVWDLWVSENWLWCQDRRVLYLEVLDVSHYDTHHGRIAVGSGNHIARIIHIDCDRIRQQCSDI